MAVVGAAEAPINSATSADGQMSSNTQHGCEQGESTGKTAAARLSERIRASFTSGGFTGRRCVVSLPRNDLFVQSIRLPKMPPSELRQAAKWEAAERFGTDPETSEVEIIRTGSSTTSPGGEGREELLVVAAPHAVLHARLNPILEAGLRPVAVDTHFCALARIFSRQFRRESDRQYVRVVLEVGASGSTVLILRGSEIAFCKLISIGGREFTQAVSEHLQLDHAAAAELRAARMAAAIGGVDEAGAGVEAAVEKTDPATDRAIYEAVRPLMGELAKDVALCLRYYGVTFRGKPAYQIVLTGGEALEPHLAAMLRTACKLPVVFDDEPETLASLLPGIGTILHRTPGTASQWAVAAGLSIRNLERADARLNERSEVRSAEAEPRTARHESPDRETKVEQAGEMTVGSPSASRDSASRREAA